MGDAGTDRRPQKHPDSGRTRGIRIDAATEKVDPGARGCGDSHHEVAGCRSDAERNPHDHVKDRDLDQAAADPQERRRDARADAADDTEPESMNVISGSGKAADKGS